MTTYDFTLALFCRVDDHLQNQVSGPVKAHPLAHLHPSEVLTIGLLHALRGGSFLGFERWLRRELASLFPRLPERTRLWRLLQKHQGLLQGFLAPPSLLGVIDSYGIELLHTRRLGRKGRGGVPLNQWAKRGKSNGRWIAGAKVAVVINSQGQVVAWDFNTANVSDLEFLPLIHQQPMLLLADKGFQLSHKKKKAAQLRKQGRTHPTNLLICERKAWPERKLIETVFALWTQVFHAKALTVRKQLAVKTRLAFLVAAYNLCTHWKGNVSLKIAHFAL